MRHYAGFSTARFPLIYFKSILVGIVAALVASVIYILAVFVVPILLPFLLSRVAGTAGAAGASFSEGPVLGIAAVAFAFGFYWQFRRGSRARPRVR